MCNEAEVPIIDAGTDHDRRQVMGWLQAGLRCKGYEENVDSYGFTRVGKIFGCALCAALVGALGIGEVRQVLRTKQLGRLLFFTKLSVGWGLLKVIDEKHCDGGMSVQDIIDAIGRSFPSDETEAAA